MGLTKSRESYRDAVWWPHISKAVKEIVQRCPYCNKHRPSQPHEPFITTPLPELPWQKLAADLCELNGKTYLIVTDYYSRWLEILSLPKASSEGVIQKLVIILARFGIPEQIVTDNGPQFRSQVFADFTEAYEITHITLRTYYTQANGMAERAVKTEKTILRQENPALALLSYRDTPTEPTRESPAKLLMGRRLRTTVPTFKQNLKPKCPNIIKVKLNDTRAKSANERTYNRRYSARLLPSLQKGDKVHVKTDAEKQWKTMGVIMDFAGTPRSLVVKTSEGDMVRRNRQHLLLTNQEENNNGSTSVPAAVILEPESGSVTPESNAPDPPEPELGRRGLLVTRSGRIVKPPIKFSY
ncbi:Transposon Ty3-I Gag-Pol poly [Labeo rohita]|uniref:Gypsy retrotransposon integrase-like protein 1 n=1 Tax=Labeo rohita TaxID=84645 RepID=A0A498LYI8_LABRO|nr:Transposon Ty3-I Gag-Pol poly [Labeo rohita]